MKPVYFTKTMGVPAHYCAISDNRLIGYLRRDESSRFWQYDALDREGASQLVPYSETRSFHEACDQVRDIYREHQI